MCGSGNKFFKETDFSDDSKHPLKNEFTSHYDAPKKACYIRINYTTRTSATTEVVVSSYVYLEAEHWLHAIGFLRQARNIGRSNRLSVL